VEPVSVWYPTLWRHKAQYNFYPVHNNFISDFKKLIFGPNTSRLSLEVASFLTEKGIFETMEDFSVLRLFGFQGKPFFLPFYVSDRHFVIEVCRQYKYWAHFFNEKRKKQFIPFPWRVGEIVVKHISHLDEFAGQFDQLGLKEAKCIKGFDPNDLFSAHMSLVGYSSYFVSLNSSRKEEETIKISLETSIDEALNDIKELASTNECYRQKGREATNKNPNSPSVSQRSTPAKTKPRSSGLETRKTPAKIQMMVVTKTLQEKFGKIPCCTYFC
jgi:hypothetical protein